MAVGRQTDGDGGRYGSRLDAHPVEAILAVMLAFLLLPVASTLFQRWLGFGGLALAEGVAVLGPALLALMLARRRWWEWPAALGLLAPSIPSIPSGRTLPVALFGALLVGAGGFYFVAAGVDALQQHLLPMSQEVQQELLRLLVPPSGPRPVVIDLLVLALLPALCEEVLFRGVLLRALAPFSPGAALLVSSLAFGAFHFSAFKFVPTTTLGVLLGALLLRAGTSWAPIVAHFVNNALVLLLLRAGWQEPPGSHSAWLPLWLSLSLFVLAWGLYIARPHVAESRPRPE